MDSNVALIIRMIRSPRVDSMYPWKWAIQKVETLEYGAGKTEADAKREAEETRAKWIGVLAKTTK